MNRILVAAHHAPSPFVSTLYVPQPVLRGATSSALVELHTDDSFSELEITLPHVLDASVRKLRVLSMHSPAIIVMETGHATA